MLLARASICFQGNKCSMCNIKQGSVAGTLSHVMELLLEANKGELIHPQQAFWAMGYGKKGGRTKSERRIKHGWRCRRWWKAQLQSLIASGNRSHFLNHIHEPIICLSSFSLSLSLLQHGLFRVHHFIELQNVLYTSDLHFEEYGALWWDERMPGWSERKQMKVKGRDKEQTCWVNHCLLMSDTVCDIQLRCLHQRIVVWVLFLSALVSVETLVCLFLVYRSYVTELQLLLNTASTHFGASLVWYLCSEYINTVLLITLACSHCMHCLCTAHSISFY